MKQYKVLRAEETWQRAVLPKLSGTRTVTSNMNISSRCTTPKKSVALSKISAALFLLVHLANSCLIRPILISSAISCNARAPPINLIFHIST